MSEDEKKEYQRTVYNTNRVDAPSIPNRAEAQPPPVVVPPGGGGDDGGGDGGGRGGRNIPTPLNPGGEADDRLIYARRRYGAGNPAQGVINKAAWRIGDRMQAAAGRREDRRNIIADWASRKGLENVAKVFRAGAANAGAREERLTETNQKVAAQGWDPGDYWNSFWGK